MDFRRILCHAISFFIFCIGFTVTLCGQQFDPRPLFIELNELSGVEFSMPEG
ncbi:hypothetical protein SAMN05421747_10189 [Parapedobacter composti]|uniref:Uncharacterized protein n=1 Tax=Parapedobacter composti TaxID=623281 RepID=A0A1I1DTU3_9SPHI|nr:hypothetical protein SAMN05421747_10189 [Parapedobacter composti]